MKKIENEVNRQYDFCCSHGLNLSRQTIIESMMQTASSKKQYEKCHILRLLLEDEIYS